MASTNRPLAFYVRAMLLIALTLFTNPTVSAPASGATAGKYIVTLKQDSSSKLGSHLDWINGVHRRSVGKRNTAGVEATFNISTWSAYAGEFDESTVKNIMARPEVAAVERDCLMLPSDVVSQEEAGWGLGTISHRERGYLNYVYDSSAGAGTYVYVVDSGIRTSHSEFGGRATAGYNAIGSKKAHTDDTGHGTHVAGIVGGSTYGVAKKTNLISVKVFKQGYNSTTSDVLKGFEWAVKDIIKKRRAGKSVINMSLGSYSCTPNACPRGLSCGFGRSMKAAITAARRDNILSVVAAGNGNRKGNPIPASRVSPANAPHALTVAAIDYSWIPAKFTNYGPEVDIFGPGVRIMSASNESDSDFVRMDGTSMATPYVAGLAVYLQAREGIRDATALASRIKALGTPKKMKGDLKGSPNLVVYNGMADDGVA